MLKGKALLRDSICNKDLAFSDEERDRYGLHGLLPFGIATPELQVEKCYKRFCQQPNDLLKHIYLTDIQNRNETLFYRLILEHLEEMMPLIYTPTVGDVSLQYSHLYNHQRGLYISFPMRDRMEELIANIPNKEVDVIVATDGERVLGLGDLGAGGMAISVGKLSLYTLLGGIHPARTLPVMIDVGTNQKDLLEDPMYVGWRHPRITGSEYDEFVERFVTAIQRRFPEVLLQWEDFGKEHARPLLERYRHRICSFNDDMQGTAAVVLSALMAAVYSIGSSLEEQKIMLFGAGTAGIGIVEQLVNAMVRHGVSQEKARERFYLIDQYGLVHEDLALADAHQKLYARKRTEIHTWSLQDKEKIALIDAVRVVKPTVLIGVSAQPGVFTQEVVETMAKATARPIIFPLSNPTSRAEAAPQDLMSWTKGKAIIATGTPFPPVLYEGRTHKITQCNNSNIFPGLGLGAISVKSKEVSNEMFIQAAETLSAHSPLKRGESALFPDIADLRRISREIAINVAKTARDQGFTAAKYSDDEICQAVDRNIWTPTI
ncbi:MAG: NAD-dependent malic enzyme [Simkania sp.]|nr:NAD-dependent malic enzyme [Simkania sp.]